MTDQPFDVDRDELLRYLARGGLTPADDVSMLELNRLGWARVFGLGGEELSIAELAGRVGLDVDDARRVLRSLGFQGEGPWDARDVVALALINDARSLFGRETVNHLARVIGS